MIAHLWYTLLCLAASNPLACFHHNHTESTVAYAIAFQSQLTDCSKHLIQDRCGITGSKVGKAYTVDAILTERLVSPSLAIRSL